jgi:hypothetical protein
MEKKMMRLLTYTELGLYSKTKLWDLHFEMLEALRTLASDTEDYKTAYMNLQHIRLFLARRNPPFPPC